VDPSGRRVGSRFAGSPTAPTSPVDPLLVGELERPAASPVPTGRVVETIATARRILERDGPGALTMRRIAEDMGIQAPSLYKHFAGKSDVERALIEEALFVIGDLTHGALHVDGSTTPLVNLLTVYRQYCVSHPNLYRLATSGELHREKLPEGLEEWAGNPWFVVTQDPSLAQALWSFAHGMLILELDERYPPGSDLDETWRAGASAFERSVASV
jgi:AcrR family transcriptional regulator